MRKSTGSSISKEDREYFEKFIQEHEPYPDDAPEVSIFDSVLTMQRDENRAQAWLYKKLLNG